MTNQNSDANTTPAVTIGEHLGRVKWFNSKLGYGFITTNLNNEDHDIFIHQSNVRPNQSRYRTLREGEYVSLNVSESGETRQAIDVTGVNGGPLNCDLERNMKTNKVRNESNQDEFTEVEPRRRSRPRPSP
jgi:cold shock protein